MKLDFYHIVGRSLIYNIKGALNQIIIIVILTAVIAGSLMTGKSVRSSLRKSSLEKLGNAGILVSSGIRYCDPSLAARLYYKNGLNCTGLLELDGFCQGFSSGQIAPQVKIFGVSDDFFSFQGNEMIKLEKGEAAVNEKLAEYLRIETGDELIVRFNPISDIPADAPFSPGKGSTGSVVVKVSKILNQAESGNFSLGISQMFPLNLFMNRSELTDSNGDTSKINRLIFKRDRDVSVEGIYRSLKDVLMPGDIGLKVRPVLKSGGFELISDRIFIDQLQVDEIKAMQINSYPVITYLANSITKGSNSAPYSFISAIDSTFEGLIPSGNGVIINRWLADDLNASVGDTVHIIWYSPDPMNHLKEEGMDFIISKVVGMEGIWGDSLLMPEFPGISKSKTCTDWDAGFAIRSDLIRDKDEEYWNRFRGTPKAFINYSLGRKLWGNNFGPATSIRFRNDVREEKLTELFRGSIEPSKAGFIITDLPEESVKAANAGVDFSTLFLSLGFFIILSAIILLILVVSSYYETKKNSITTLFSMGFPNPIIEKLMFIESVIIAVSGAIAGAFAGAIFNKLIIKALNSVWQGAVQTKTLAADFDIPSLFIGFLVSVSLILIILKVKSARYLKSLNTSERGRARKPPGRTNLIFSVIFLSLSVLLTALSLIFDNLSTLMSFMSGILIFVSMILFTRQYYITGQKKSLYSFRNKQQVSSAYFSFHPNQAIAPVLFLAAGLFAVIITGVNRMNISGNMLLPGGGTGGYLLWGESAVPVRYEPGSSQGKKEFGFNESDLTDLSVVSIRKKPGNDASCLNLNHVASPSLLGLDPGEFIKRGAFSFGVSIRQYKHSNPWISLDQPPQNNCIYGIADQTVLQYGLKLKVGDTLKIRVENGLVLNVIISAGLKSSVFQGYVLIGHRNFTTFFPSVSGSQIFLVNGDPEKTDLYKDILTDRLSEFGAHFETSAEKLSSFFVVTNTYLSVFTILGGIGIILGVAGLGFVLIRNFNQRRRDFGLMMASGFQLESIRRIVFTEQSFILVAGTLTGLISALIATRPSVIQGSGIPWSTILVMVILILLSGFTALMLSVRSITKESLTGILRKE